MATGDVKAGIRKLEQRLRLLTYPRDVDYSGLVKGDPSASLPIISYAFTCYSTHIAEILVSLDIELTAKSDLRFIDSVYKVLRDVFNYKPVLTKQQFLQYAFSERKIQIVCDIIDCVMKKHKEFINKNKVKPHPIKKNISVKDTCEIFYPEETYVQPPQAEQSQKKPLVERHTGHDLNLPPLCTATRIHPPPSEEETSVSESEPESPCTPLASKDESTQIELLKIQIAECQEKLQRFDWMEERIHTLETEMKGKIIIDETDWNNLLSRVLLLETDRLINSKKRDLSSEFTAISDERTSSRMTNEACRDFKAKGDIHENHHQSSGYSSLLSADISPIAIDINHSNLTENPKETARQRMERIGKMMEETTQLLKISSKSS
ncbi:centrosomal protein of 44 kDa [Spea bombifrons]|uniref:centrosomal protein of 44 kDa n=1 Tax=Spea bombifrons TaxID=233779 RepID=UPI00234B1AC6|nr:centrosomal protein of 44 kDa [Spea bombifrons]